MAKVKSIPPRATPRVTFSALADILALPAARMPKLLEAQKYPQPGPVFGYKIAEAQLEAWVLKGTTPNLQAKGLRPHEVDALQDALKFGSSAALLPPGAQSASSAPKGNPWHVGGVEISMQPDLLITGKAKKGTATGALKFYLRKDPIGVGPMMAALLFYHRSQVLKIPNVDPSLCAVTDVQDGVVHVATGSYQRLVAQIQSVCMLIASVWPNL